MTTNEITAAIRRKVLETTDEVVTNETVLLNANLAYTEVYKRVVTANKIVSTSIVCSNGTCTLPSNYGRSYSNAYDADGNEFPEVSVADYYSGDFDYAYTVQAGAIKVSRTDITALTIYYYAQPETLTTTQDPTIDSYFHEVVVYGAVARIHEDLQDEELAEQYYTRAENELVRRMAHQSNYEESNQKGGVMFKEQTLI